MTDSRDGASRRSMLRYLFSGLGVLALPRFAAAEADELSKELNRVLDQSLGSRPGAAVVAEVSSGKVLTAKNLSAASQRLALPGSTLKTFTLIALLESGKLRPDETFVCPYGLKVGGHNLDCPHPPNLGPIDPVQALSYSCNNFFARMGQRLTPQELRHALVGWGFTSPTHLVPSEATGEVLLARSPSEQELQAIGEAAIHVTPLELLQSYRLVAQRRLEPAPSEPMKIAFAGLEAGTAYGMAAAAATPGLFVAGKTGTAVADEGKWTHGWFCGYAPADKPEIVQVIFLERGRGPTDAAGIGHDVFAAYRDTRGR
jgi:cell division protein FtsI/penicillin-binding protein 2